MDYISTTEAGLIWGLTSARVRTLAREGKIAGAKIVGNSWLIPKAADKPMDGRTRAGRSGGAANRHFPLLLFSKSSDERSSESYSNEEILLLAAQEAVASGRFEEALKDLEKLARASADPWIKAGALHDLCLCHLALGSSFRFLHCANELKNLVEKESDEFGALHLVLSNIESYYQGSKSLANGISVGFDSKLPDGMWAFLASQATYAAMVECLGGGAFKNVSPLEIICHELEEKGLLYAALMAHLNTAIACFFSENVTAAQAHLLRATVISCNEDYPFPIAVNSPYTDKYLVQVLSAFPQEYASKVLLLGKQIHQGYQTIVQASGESHIFSSVDKTDYEYIVYAVQGLTNKEIATMKNLSTVTVSRKYSAICQKLSIGSKKELAAVAQAGLAQYNIEPSAL